MVMNWLDVFLVALSLVALRKAQTKPTGPPAFRNSSESNTTAEPTVEPWRLRLMDGGSSCSGRVELEYNGAWGTVCDDNWDLADAEVVCQQLGCGWAIQAVNASHFQKGTGPIHLDEVKCLGNEPYLSNCPSEENQDCGHKEDAGVICSEHQEWRLSGGLDACAGRVEVFYHGIWNTVCDGNWYQNEADVLCRSLGCSEKASVSRVAFNHTLLGKMFYQCIGSEDSLASCDWRYNKASLCEQFRAAGVICNGSLGLGGSTDTPGPEAVTPTSHLSSSSWSSPESWEPTPSYQMLQILCIVLGIFLFLVTLTLIITLKWRRKNGTLDCAVSSGLASAPALVNHSAQITASEARHDYREIPTSLPKEEVRPVPVSEDSDSDYEHYDFNHKPPVALSTFYNSLRHRAADEDFIVPALPAEHETGYSAFESDPCGAQPVAEDSDSTSSGDAEWYENIQKPEQQKDHPGNETSFEGMTTFSGPLVNCEAGPETGSFDSSDYDDTWS